MTSQPLWADIYSRQSQDRDNTGLAIARQLEACQQLREQRGYLLHEHRSDNDTSAAGSRKRPGFDAVLDDLEQGRIKAVIAWDFSRLSRNARDWLRLSEAAQKAKARLIFVNGPETDMSNPLSRGMADIANIFARMEIETKSLRQRAAREQAAQDGRRVGGRKPFGYQQDGVTIIPAEAAAVRQGYADFLAGVSLSQIAKNWNAAGLKAHRNAWIGNTVRQVLSNPRNAGLMAYRPVDLPKGVEPELFPAEWPALVPIETFHAVKTVLADPSRRTLRGTQALLTGAAKCGIEMPDGSPCAGHAVTGAVTNANYRLYKCNLFSGHFGRKAEPIDDLVETYILARLSRDDAVELLVDRNKPDVADLTLRRNTLVKRLDQLAVDFADGDLTPSQLRTATERIKSQVAEIDLRLADAGKVNVLGPLIEAEDPEPVWDAMDNDRRREVIKVMVDVTIYPAGRGARKFDPSTVEIIPKPGME